MFMRSVSRIAASQFFRAALCAAALFISDSQAQTSKQLSVRQVQVLGSKNAVEIQVEASDRIVPQAQVLTNPDRLVIDFPNAVPGKELRSQSVYRGQVKDLRVGLFQSKPPVTRIVLDLNSAQSYQIFPGQMVIIKVMNAPDTIPTVADYPEPTGRSGLISANYVAAAARMQPASIRADAIRPEPTHAEPARLEPTPADAPHVLAHADLPPAGISQAGISQAPPAPAPKPLDVSFSNGLLTVHSNKATLSEVLFAVQQRTGADIAIAAGAEQEKVVVDLGPAPAPEVLAQLLNGSKFNFLILSDANDPRQLDKVILSPRVEVAVAPPPPQFNQPDESAEEEPAPQPAPVHPMPQPGPARMHRAPVQPPPQPEAASNTKPDETNPNETNPNDNPQNPQNPPNQ